MLLDLGGVLVRFDGLAELQRLLPGRPALDEATARWLASDAVRAFERGAHGDAGRFAREAVLDLELDLEPSEFLSRFERWVPGTLPGAEDVLRDLRRQLPSDTAMACMSNTNPLHAQRFERWFPGAFDHTFFSHRTGKVKPDAEAFELVAQELRLRPEEIWFADDSRPNVIAAAARGWRAAHVRGPDQLRQALVESGLLATNDNRAG